MTYYSITRNGQDTGVRFESMTLARLAICSNAIFNPDDKNTYDIQPVEG